MRQLLWALLGALLLMGPACTSGTTSGGRAFEPAQPDVLTVATANLPVPGFWEGPVDNPTKGFEAELASLFADRLGLAKVRVVQQDFTAIVAGDLGGADLALAQVTPTAERDRAVDFSTPYLTSPATVLVRQGIEARDAAALRDLHWAAIEVSTLTPRVTDDIRPHTSVAMVASRGEALDLLRSGRADAILLDLQVAQSLARAEPDHFAVAGQLASDETIAAVLPDASPNLQIVDSTIRALQADGTIAELQDRWFGGRNDDVPLIRTSG